MENEEIYHYFMNVKKLLKDTSGRIILKGLNDNRTILAKIFECILPKYYDNNKNNTDIIKLSSFDIHFLDSIFEQKLDSFRSEIEFSELTKVISESLEKMLLNISMFFCLYVKRLYKIQDTEEDYIIQKMKIRVVCIFEVLSEIFNIFYE